MPEHIDTLSDEELLDEFERWSAPDKHEYAPVIALALFKEIGRRAIGAAE